VRERGREGGRDGGREGGREGGKEGGREGGREGGAYFITSQDKDGILHELATDGATERVGDRFRGSDRLQGEHCRPSLLLHALERFRAGRDDAVATVRGLVGGREGGRE